MTRQVDPWSERVARAKASLHTALNTGAVIDRKEVDIILKAAHKAMVECERAKADLAACQRLVASGDTKGIATLRQRIDFLAAENSTLAMRIRNRRRLDRKGMRPGTMQVIASIVHCDCKGCGVSGAAA